MATRCLPQLLAICLLQTGCMLVPDKVHQPRYQNPFPQLARVAVLPFFNLSDEPTLNQDDIALAYFNELQTIPGFEVVPVGVVKQAMVAHRIQGNSADDFRQLARILNVDAVIVGAVTEYTPYYPPRLGLAVDWYAANPCFHPIPPGYGLPWGTAQEEYIPEELVDAAEFALAREQLKTQTPSPAPELPPPPPPGSATGIEGSNATILADAPPASFLAPEISDMAGPDMAGLPPDWPDPSGFIPPPPSAQPPPCIPQNQPIITHVRLYHGNDSDFTTALANYYYFRDEARFGGWQSYLQRSEDFIRFCCHLHLTETLAARGGARKTRVVWRWPIGRYER